MKYLAVTQRMETDEKTGIQKDSLDERWFDFFSQCALTPILFPNRTSIAKDLMEGLEISGILLTGGNSLEGYGGKAAERDAMEYFLLSQAAAKQIPLIGVCRGMQVIQTFFGVKLHRVEDHVQPKQMISVNGSNVVVNSYHEWGTRETVEDLSVWAVAPDGIVKAVQHKKLPIFGVMWHPERFDRFRNEDIEFFNNVYHKPL